MAVILCVSCTQELRNLMKEKQISPSEALRVGVYKLVSEPYVPEVGVKILETERTKREQIQNTMQARINELNQEIEGMKKKNVV